MRLDELLLQAHEQLLRRHPTCRVDLAFGEADSFVVRGNEALLLAAILNVLDNACKYSAGATAPVLATLLPAAGHLRLLVQDHGPGIAPQYQEKIFQRFVQIPDKNGYKGGSGLGLSIAREFISSQNGQLWVESELGAGSTFLFTLPLATPEAG